MWQWWWWRNTFTICWEWPKQFYKENFLWWLSSSFVSGNHKVGDTKKFTSVKESTNCPYYNEVSQPNNQVAKNQIMTAFQYNHSFGFQKPMKVKVVKWGWKNWNEHDLMHIYHKQCEIIQKIEWNSSNGQIYCFHYVR